MAIGVTGATGQLGQKVIKSLIGKQPSSEIVAIVRNPDKAAHLGVQVRAADYGNPAALEQAFAGINKLLLISSNSFGERATHHSNVIDAAKKAGVAHIIYTGILHADALNVELASDHKLTEKKLVSSGLPFTVLRNGWYWENHTISIAPALTHGALVGSSGDGRISYASRQDFADAAVAVLTGGGHEGKLYELAGDHGHTLSDLAAEAARQSGKPLAYHNLEKTAHAEFLASVGLPPSFATILAEVESRALGAGQLFDNSHALSRLIGRPTTTLEQAVADALREIKEKK